MLFKVSFSLLTYVVNPDAMTDKSQGAGKLIQRIIISLSLLAVLPNLFTRLADFQSHILEDGTIQRIILGDKGINGDVADIADETALATYDGIFFCTNFAEDGGCKDDVESNYGVEVKSVADLVDYINKEDGAGYYRYSYLPVIGFIVGAAMSLVMISMCIDVAIRVFKLVILQLIAPIPIIGYIDPKASKDGAFSKWLKLLISVWLELFIRLAIVYFAVFIIAAIANKGGNGVEVSDNPLVNIALIIGLLFFAKDAPKFFSEALGIKVPERGLFSGLGNIVAAGAITAGSVGSFAASARGSYASDRTNGKRLWPHNILKNVGAGLFGGVGGMITGGAAAINAKDHQTRAVMEAMNKRNQLELSRGAAGSTFLGRTGNSVRTFMVGESAANRMKNREKELADAGKALNEHKSTIESRFNGNEEYIMEYGGKQFNWAIIDRTYHAAESGDQSAVETINNTFGSMDKFRSNYDDIHKEGYRQYANSALVTHMDAAQNKVDDKVIVESYKNVKFATKDVKVDKYDIKGKVIGHTNLTKEVNTSYDSIKASSGMTASTRGDLLRSPEYRSAIVNSDNGKK